MAGETVDIDARCVYGEAADAGTSQAGRVLADLCGDQALEAEVAETYVRQANERLSEVADEVRRVGDLADYITTHLDDAQGIDSNALAILDSCARILKLVDGIKPERDEKRPRNGCSERGGKTYKYVMHVTETVESQVEITSDKELTYEELEERAEKERVAGGIDFIAVSDVSFSLDTPEA